jgi:hypothetical protein
VCLAVGQISVIRKQERRIGDWKPKATNLRKKVYVANTVIEKGDVWISKHNQAIGRDNRILCWDWKKGTNIEKERKVQVYPKFDKKIERSNLGSSASYIWGKTKTRCSGIGLWKSPLFFIW